MAKTQTESILRGSQDIVPDTQRKSAITSHSIGVPELGILLDKLPADAPAAAYRDAVIDQNVLGLDTESGRDWRFSTLRRLYLLDPESLLFRALRELWPDDTEAHPLLAGLCAMARDVVFRATAELIVDSSPGAELSSNDFAEKIHSRFEGAYADSTVGKIASNAYTSWEQTGHLGTATGGSKRRLRAVCRPANVAYALMLGHLNGERGEALFQTKWVQILDHPRSHLQDLAFAAAQRRMLEYRHAGGVIEVSFNELLRPSPDNLF